MNVGNIIKVVKEIASEKYPDEPEIAEFCEMIIRYERDNISSLKPHYKEPYKKYLSDCLKNK